MEVDRVPYKDLAYRDAATVSSEAVRERVLGARRMQEERFQGSPVPCNARMSSADVARFCRPDAGGVRLLEAAFERLGLSARAYHRILKVSRTIADLEGAGDIGTGHVAEAVQYRSLDRQVRFDPPTPAKGGKP